MPMLGGGKQCVGEIFLLVFFQKRSRDPCRLIGGAIMDKSRPPGLITSHATKAAEISAEKKTLKMEPLNPKVLPMY
jgi:hypothetical protein